MYSVCNTMELETVEKSLNTGRPATFSLIGHSLGPFGSAQLHAMVCSLLNPIIHAFVPNSCLN
jgi:hypothetical protein